MEEVPLDERPPPPYTNEIPPAYQQPPLCHARPASTHQQPPRLDALPSAERPLPERSLSPGSVLRWRDTAKAHLKRAAVAIVAMGVAAVLGIVIVDGFRPCNRILLRLPRHCTKEPPY